MVDARGRPADDFQRAQPVWADKTDPALAVSSCERWSRREALSARPGGWETSPAGRAHARHSRTSATRGSPWYRARRPRPSGPVPRFAGRTTSAVD